MANQNELKQIQLKMEENVLKLSREKVDKIFENKVEHGQFAGSAEGMALIRTCLDKFSEQIAEWTKNNRNHSIARTVIKEYFKQEEHLELAYSVLSTVINTIAMGRDELAILSKEVFANLEEVILMKELERDKPLLLESIDNKKRKGWVKAEQKMKLAKANHYINIENKSRIKVGLSLLTIMQESGIGLFEQTKRKTHKGEVQILRFKNDIYKIIDLVQNNLVRLNVQYKPMVVEPKDWETLYDNGGYLTDNSLSFIKHNKSAFKSNDILEEYEKTGKIQRMFNIVNKVQKTKWQINRKVLEVVNIIIKNNLEDPKTTTKNKKLYCGIPHSNNRDVIDIVPENYDDNIPGSKQKWYKEYLEAQDYQMINTSNRIAYSTALQLAKEYSNYDHFYFTYNTDFRGRLYPIQQSFNPQTTGKIKALLQFKEGQILDEKGLYWLKIHIANTFGMDKDDYPIRIKWFDDNEQMIINIGKNPLDNLKYLGDEDPLMFLAGCFAYKDYLDGKKVQLPLALDATCSGIQIYSGLLLDKEGAESVNVIGNTRKDIYQDVADEANKILNDKDHPSEYKRMKKFKEGDIREEIKHTYKVSDWFKGKISRKLVKRNVMTTPYSVSKRGMFFQIKEILDADKANGGNLFYEGEEGTSLKLLTDVNELAINRTVKGAKIGQDFIVSIIAKINKRQIKEGNDNQPIMWTNPVGFPVIQWYQREKPIQVRAGIACLRLKQKLNKTNKVKQKSGIAPNLIHSLDAALLFMTVEDGFDNGIDNFMLIHDSFSVLPNDVEQLNKSFRESYVKLFKDKPLEKWVKQVDEDHENVEIPYIGDLKLEEVLESGYIIS